MDRINVWMDYKRNFHSIALWRVVVSGRMTLQMGHSLGDDGFGAKLEDNL